MNYQLTITDDDGKEIVKVHIGELNPITATITVLSALQTTPQPRKPRSDRGTTRKPETAATT